MSAPFWGQPGDPYDDPKVDTTLPALFDAFDALRAAALFADDADAAATVADMLAVAEMVKFGFKPGTDEAQALHLCITVIRRAAAEVAA